MSDSDSKSPPPERGYLVERLIGGVLAIGVCCFFMPFAEAIRSLTYALLFIGYGWICWEYTKLHAEYRALASAPERDIRSPQGDRRHE